MFHYRQTLTGNRLRLAIAAIIAMGVHLGLLRFTFDLQSRSMPHVSLPQSVSIFLGQKNNDSSAEVPNSVAELKSSAPVSAVEAATVPAIAPVQRKEHDRSNNSAPLSQKEPKELSKITTSKALPAVRAIEPVLQKTEFVPASKLSGVLPSAEVHEVEGKKMLPAGKAGERDLQPGAIQTAYPRYHLNSPPFYPGLARKRGQEGTVILQVLVNKEGRVDDLEIEDSSGFGLLDRAAETAVRKWLFDPAKHGQQEVSMWVRVPVTFRLKE